jgi:hypothetical protein
MIQGECDHRIYAVSAPKVGDFGLGVLKSVPQRLKPRLAYGFYGTAEAVPFVCEVFPQPFAWCRGEEIRGCGAPIGREGREFVKFDKFAFFLALAAQGGEGERLFPDR